MHVWLDLITRELVFVALLAAIGSGPATFLPERFDSVARWALAPVLGLCASVCMTVTLVYAFPTRDTGWVVIVLAVASLALALWRGRGRARWRRSPGAFRTAAERSFAARQSSAIVRDGLQVGVVVIVILVSFNYPLALRHTVGPDGGYSIADTTGYVSETNGEERDSIHQAERLQPPFADLSTFYWAAYAHNFQQLDVSALESNVNVLLGLESTDTDSPFLIAVLLVGALGAFAVVRAAMRRPSWAASLAGCLFAGPLFVEMFMDGSQGAIGGSAVLAPVVALGYEALRHRRTATLVLFALLAAGLQTVYPLFLPSVVIGGLLAIAVMAVRRLSRGWPSLGEVGLAIGQLAGVIALAALFTPVAFERNLRYWIALLNGSFALSGLPAYVLPFDVMPGWVLQTREFYGLVSLSSASAGQFILAALVPALIVGVIAWGVVRHRTAAVLLAVAGGAALLALYTWSSHSCGYCVQRNSIPIATLAIPALGIGLATLAGIRGRAGVIASVVVGGVVLVAVGREGVTERQREAQGSYMLESQDRQALAGLPRDAGPVELEGFGQGPAPPMELPLVYNLVDERVHGDVSEPTATDDGRGLLYLGGIQPLGPSFRPDYRYVLTRLAGIVTARPVVARYGPVALEKRVQSLDVTITGGASVAAARFDPSGTAWVSNLLQFLVVGGRPGSPAWVSLLFEKTVPVTVAPQPEVVSVGELGSALRVCLRAHAAPVARGVALKLEFTPQQARLPPERYATPLPPRGVRLVRMSASATSCVHH
jgi:hypothetical protein